MRTSICRSGSVPVRGIGVRPCSGIACPGVVSLHIVQTQQAGLAREGRGEMETSDLCHHISHGLKWCHEPWAGRAGGFLRRWGDQDLMVLLGPCPWDGAIPVLVWAGSSSQGMALGAPGGHGGTWATMSPGSNSGQQQPSLG